MTQLKNVNIFQYANFPDISQLIRTIQGDFSVAEEMFDFIPLHGTSKDMDIFEVLNKVVLDYGRFDKFPILSLMAPEL